MFDQTLEKLQALKAEAFHALCDELLPRIDACYHPIVPHGRNQQGDSIRGQPDSYIGDSAATCRIAIQHTVQKRQWWSKLVDDVIAAKAACPKAEEIVVAVPRDVDREKPSKGNGLNWRESAVSAATPAKLTILNGRALAQQLDGTCQDLRLNYLGIPVSRLSWDTVLMACQHVTRETLQRLQDLGRYRPNEYLDREFDDRLLFLWQQCLLSVSRGCTVSERKLLVPLIADSGIGKTSLLARFVDRSSSRIPMLLLLARDLDFDAPHALLRHVMERLQGLMDASAQPAEESHLVSLLAGKTPLTVVVDGLDEAADATGVRKAVNSWAQSRLGQTAVLLVSSRPEFWRTCRDSTWAKLILQDEDHPKAAKSLRHERDIESLDPMQGIELPGRFSSSDALRAWSRSNRSEADYWRLPPDVRKELRHPFTMKAAADLIAAGTSIDALQTRSHILAVWVEKRLEAEADMSHRISPSLYRSTLLTMARLAAANDGSWVPVDDLSTLPRFDPAAPPGPVVQRLLAANLLETHPDRSDHIRFTTEAIQDFFLAQAAVADIVTNPVAAARRFAALPFSKVAARLERIGNELHSHSCREDFVQALAALDGPMAAAVMRPAVSSYSASCRKVVAERLAQLLTSRFDAENALATELLGRLKCVESAVVLERHWMIHAPSKRVHAIVASAAISHGITALVPLVFRTWWFLREDYFIDIRPELQASADEFRKALAAHAYQFIPANEHSDNYQRALSVLGYLANDYAVDAIRQRTRDAMPYFYESQYLLAVGTAAAVTLYSSLVDSYIANKRNHGDPKQEHEVALMAYGSHIANFTTQRVEDFIVSQLDSPERERQLIGRFLAEKIGSPRLLALMIKRWKVDGYHIPGTGRFGRRLGCETWLSLWSQNPTLRDRKALIEIAADLRDTRIEDALIVCLEDDELAGKSAQSLAEMGGIRACPAFRRLLTRQCSDLKVQKWMRHGAFHALARLRDPACVPDMVKYLESEEGRHEFEGTVGLASIGTVEAEEGLFSLRNQSDGHLVVGLIHFGSSRSVRRAVELAKAPGRGPAWLLHESRWSFQLLHGWSRQHFRRDVDLEPLLEFVRSEKLSAESARELLGMLEHIDSPIVRTWLREWYFLRNTSEDIAMKSPEGTMLSELAFRELAERGDDTVSREFLEHEVERSRKHLVDDWVIRELAIFDRDKLRVTLNAMSKEETDPEKLVALIDLLGHLGNQSALSKLDSWIESASLPIANAAFDAKLRLTDPLRLVAQW
ncbi:MAG TPA: hypothetical protein VJ783_13570 [Pirellulales bacterium]|nr:hypothetical protein [Pirellulales bacterium]